MLLLLQLIKRDLHTAQSIKYKYNLRFISNLHRCMPKKTYKNRTASNQILFIEHQITTKSSQAHTISCYYFYCHSYYYYHCHHYCYCCRQQFKHNLSSNSRVTGVKQNHSSMSREDLEKEEEAKLVVAPLDVSLAASITPSQALWQLRQHIQRSHICWQEEKF